MILVRLGIQRADLPLPKGIVERRIDLIGRDVESRCGCAVDRKMRADPIVLLIGRDIHNLRELAQPGYRFFRPRIQL